MDADTESPEANLLTKLNDLQDFIQKGDLDKIKGVIDWFHNNLLSNQDLLAKLYKSGRKCVTQTDLIISACFQKQADALYYLLNETDILDYLTDASFDDNEVDTQRRLAFRYAICSDDFSMVETLYDYWCGNTHCFGNDIDDIKKIRCLLEDALTACQDRVIKDQKLRVDIHCLLTFNNFQQTLYTELCKLKRRTSLPNDTHNEAKALGTMLLNVLRIYDEYSDIDVVRLPKSIQEHEQAIKARLKDKSTVFFRALTCIMYEVYFRKLDICVSSMILENLDVLRRHLKNRFNKPKEFLNKNPKLYTIYTRAANLYGEIECTIYHFIYRTIEDWRLYLPANRTITILKNRIGVHKGQIIPDLKLKYDQHKLDNGPVLFFERRNFKTCLGELRKILEEHVISKDPALAEESVTQHQNDAQHKVKKEVEIFLDDNYLKQTACMRDHYSLRKIVHYIEAVENSKEINVLMIERALQVIGEMLKSTDESSHLSSTTKALLQTELSVETIKHFHNIRKYLSRVNKGQLSRRIDIDIQNGQERQTFEKIKENLENIKQSINPILDIYKPILDKSLLEKGVYLLEERIEELPCEARQHKDDIYKLYERQGKQLFSESSEFIQNVWKHTGFTAQILQEICWIQSNRKDLLSKQQIASTRITGLAVTILPKYIQNIKRTLQLITQNNNNVLLVKQQLLSYGLNKRMPDYPEQTHINDLLVKLHKSMKETKNQDNQLLSNIDQIKDLSIHWKSIKYVLKLVIVEMDCEVFAGININFVTEETQPDVQTLDNIQKILAEMERICLIQNPSPTHPGLVLNHSFDGIKELDENIYIKTNNRDELMFCLTKRLSMLKDTLEYSKTLPLSLHLLRYKHDQRFRLVLEMLLADIANVLAECKIRFMNKSAKLLTGIDLGNVLDHGNPFLEVIGDVFNSREIPTELLSKAIMFAEDEESIAALYEMFKNNIDREDIKLNNRNALNDEQKRFLDQLKKSDRWESYLKLIPKSKTQLN